MSYISATDLAAYLGIDDSTDAILIQELANAASNWIDRVTGRTFAAAADSTHYLDASAIDGDVLWLDGDLCAVTSVTNGDGVLVAANQYNTRPRNRTPWYALERKGSASFVWDGLSGEIAIVGKWAFSVTPDDTIVHTCRRLAAWLYRQKDNMGDTDRAVLAAGSVVLPSRLPADIADLLHSYKRLTT